MVTADGFKFLVSDHASSPCAFLYAAPQFDLLAFDELQIIMGPTRQFLFASLPLCSNNL